MKRTEMDITTEVCKELKKLGAPIIKKEVLYKNNPKRIADVVAYSIDENGRSFPHTVVEVRAKPAPNMQKVLQDAAKNLDSHYALLVVNGERYWFEAKNFLPIPPPDKIVSHGNFSTDPDEILVRLFSILDYMRGYFTSYETIWILGYSLLIRLHLHKVNELKKWSELETRDQYLELLSQILRNLNIYTNEIGIRGISDDFLKRFIEMMDQLPPEHDELGRLFLEFVQKSGGENRDLGQFFLPKKLREMVRKIIASMKIEHGKIIDLTVGFGGLLYEICEVIKSKDIVGFEISKEVATLAKIVMTLGQYHYVEINQADSLLIQNLPNTYDLVVIDPPFGGRFSKEKINQYSNYHLTNYGSRLSIDIADLFIEQAIRLARPGGYIVALVTESMLFKNPTDTRDFIRNHTFIEGIISLPSHTMKPYSAIKVNLLILRKKRENELPPKNLFLGNPESVEELSDIAELFVKWKEGELAN